MKKIKILGLFLCLLLSINLSYSQAKKPELMVIPSESMCSKYNCMFTANNQGVETQYPNYRKALNEIPFMTSVIAKLSELMNGRQFPLADLSGALNNMEQSAAMGMMIESSQGSSIVESPLDKLLSGLACDIRLEVDWMINRVGPKSSITYSLRGIDAYTNIAVASISGTGEATMSADVPILLEEAVVVNMDGFAEQLQGYFDDLLDNGRAISLDLLVFDNGSGVNLESEIGANYDELLDVIDNWLYDNTVNHRYNIANSTANMASIRQVRIPLYDERGRAMSANDFANSLRKFLRAKPYNIESKRINKGLGGAVIVIGEK